MENEDLYRNLVMFLKMFKDRPYQLSKYLIENSAFTDEFINKIKNSEKLKKMDEEPKQLPEYFSNISEMNSFYDSLIDIKHENIEKMTKDLNNKLDDLIKNEKYEDAARVRDYMIRNNIKRN